MNIGNLKTNEEGVHIGRIATLAFSATVALRPFQSTNERAPRFDIVALSADNRSWVKVGALWEFHSNETGEAFLSGRIDDPSLANAIDIALFRQDDGSYNVAWRRPKVRAAMPEMDSADEGQGSLPPVGTTQDQSASGPASTGQASGDGLGESTAPGSKAKAKTAAKQKETADA